MYTAKINRKDYIDGVVRVFVDFTEGEKTYTEACIPQDENGLKFWVKSRLATYNTGPVIESVYVDGAVVDVSEPVVVPPIPTAQEIAKEEWFKNYKKWIKVKTTLIDTGVLTGNETKVLALQNKVRTDFLLAYIDSI